MSLLRGTLVLQGGSGVLLSGLLRITLPERSIARVLAISWNNSLGVAMPSTTKHLLAYITHNQRETDAVSVKDLAEAWAIYDMNRNALVEGGGFVQQTFIQHFPEPGYWIGGDQLVTMLDSANPMRLTTVVWYVEKVVTVAQKAIILERTVTPLPGGRGA